MNKMTKILQENGKEEEVNFLKLFAVDEDEFKKVKDVNPERSFINGHTFTLFV